VLGETRAFLSLKEYSSEAREKCKTSNLAISPFIEFTSMTDGYDCNLACFIINLVADRPVTHTDTPKSFGLSLWHIREGEDFQPGRRLLRIYEPGFAGRVCEFLF
jgi:hypothetical protein